MGCCCPKQTNDDESDERARLLNSDSNQKSRFVDQTTQQIYQQQTSQQQQNGMLRNANYIDISNENTYQQTQQTQGQQNQQSESNQLFEKILSEIIPVVSTTIDQRAAALAAANAANNTNTTTSNIILNTEVINTNQFMQDMPFKMKGLLEPQKNQLQLPEGVTAPLSVLAAQPPFMFDVRLINNFAYEANMCINNYTLEVPKNVAFNFNNPIA